MMKKLKRKFGYIRRGIRGYFQDKFIKPPPIPGELKAVQIGASVKGRPINCFQIGNGPHKFLYASGIHGNETGTVKLAHHFIDWAFKNPQHLKNYTLFVIPCLNPDGYSLACAHPEYFKGGKTGRFNANNVDLNRNFDTPSFKRDSKWSFGKNYSEKIDVYCGEHGCSEPEIKGLTEFLKHQKIQVLCMFHNAGKDVMANTIAPAPKLAHLYAQKTGFQLMKEGYWKELQQTGTAAEWCDIHNIAYVEIEGSTRWSSDWDVQKEAIAATIEEHSAHISQ